MRLRIVAIFGFCLWGLGSRARAEQARYDWRIEDGLEYDTNPSRAESIAGGDLQPASPASLLTRLVTSGSFSAALGESNVLAVSGALGGKWFVDGGARADNVQVVQGSASDSLQLGRRTQAALSCAYYDVYQRRSFDLPDFRSTAPSLRLDQGLGKSVLVSLGGGYRWFDFKPDGTYSFASPTAFVAIRHTLPGDLLTGGADWEWSAGGSVEERNFDGPACTAGGCGDQAGVPRHRDRFWIGHAEFSRTGNWLFGLGAALHVNQSNSYGEALLRGLFHARAVIPLPWNLSLSARGEIVATRYADPLTFVQPVAGLPSASIEDEARSTFRVELARLVEGSFELGARYVYYTSAPTSGALGYRRQTLLLYLAFLDES
jgi:hypothetical protein